MTRTGNWSRPGPDLPPLPPASPAGLPGWAADDHAAAVATYARTAPPDWPRLPAGGDARDFLESRFRAGAATDGLATGYYEPEVPGALAPSAATPAAIYGLPPDLPRPRPWHDRRTLETGDALRGLELAWLESPLEAFLAQVQGSLRVRLPDGAVRRYGYAGRNGHPYTSIGRELIRRGELPESDASVAAIRRWADSHPGQVTELLRINASFVFFRLLDLDPQSGPLGSLGQPVTPMRSIAVDPDHVPLGAPVWVEWDGNARLMIAQDTGSAIRGAGRCDVFFGTGPQAGEAAGSLKSPCRLTVLTPRAV